MSCSGFLLGVALLVPLCAQAQMYKCVDARGVTRYTDAPGAGCKPVDIRGSPPISGAIRAPETDLAKEEAEFRRRQIERETALSQQKEEQEKRCTQLRREHALLAGSSRIVGFNAKGEREYMDDNVRYARVAELQRQLAACP